MAHGLKLKIAGIVFIFHSNLKSPLKRLEKNYKIFVSSENPEVKVYLRLNINWRTNRKRSAISKPVYAREISFIRTGHFDACVDLNGNEIIIDAGPDVGMADVVKFLCSFFLSQNGGFLLHASSVIRKGKGYVFFGPSGSGKTTVARLSKDLVLSDETTAVNSKKKRFYACATPFSGEFDGVTKNAQAPLKAMFLLKKGREFRHEKMDNDKAVRSLFENVMMSVADSFAAGRLFATFADLANKVPCYELYFKPDTKIWRYIDERIG